MKSVFLLHSVFTAQGFALKVFDEYSIIVNGKIIVRVEHERMGRHRPFFRVKLDKDDPVFLDVLHNARHLSRAFNAPLIVVDRLVKKW